MPYSHPYKPNSGHSDGSTSRQQKDSSRRQNPTPEADFEDWIHTITRQLDSPELERRAEEWSQNLQQKASTMGAGLLDAVSGALSQAGKAVSRWAEGEQELTFAQWRQRIDRRLMGKDQLSGLVLAIVGGTLTFGFGVAMLVLLIVSAVDQSILSPEARLAIPILIVMFALFTLGFGVMTGLGVRGFRQFGRIRSYLRAAHDWVAAVPDLAQATGHSPRQVRRELLSAINRGKLPGAVLSMEQDLVYFREDLFVADRQNRQQQSPPPQETPDTQPVASAPVEQFQAQVVGFVEYLDQCRGRLDSTADEELSRMKTTCRAILDFIRSHPDQLPRLRRFTDYYLPTTRKLLDTARGLAPVEADSARSIRRDITGILHTLNTAYVQLYDTLLQDVSLDVSSEIDTLEAMLRQDGLAGGFASDFGIQQAK